MLSQMLKGSTEIRGKKNKLQNKVFWGICINKAHAKQVDGIKYSRMDQVKIYGKQPLKKIEEWYGMLRQTILLQIF